MSLVFQVPTELAEELVRDQLAGIPLLTRSDPAAVSLLMAVAGVMSASVSVITAVNTIPDVSHKIVAWVRRNHPATPGARVAISITRSDGARVDIAITGVDDATAGQLVSREMRIAAGILSSAEK